MWRNLCSLLSLLSGHLPEKHGEQRARRARQIKGGHKKNSPMICVTDESFIELILMIILRELHPTAAEQGGGSCCNATERFSWRQRRVRQLRWDTVSKLKRSEPHP